MTVSIKLANCCNIQFSFVWNVISTQLASMKSNIIYTFTLGTKKLKTHLASCRILFPPQSNTLVSAFNLEYIKKYNELLSRLPPATSEKKMRSPLWVSKELEGLQQSHQWLQVLLFFLPHMYVNEPLLLSPHMHSTPPSNIN